MIGVGNRAAVQELLEGTARYVENRDAEARNLDRRSVAVEATRYRRGR